MSAIIHILTIVTVWATLNAVRAGLCPAKQVITPCTCEDDLLIVCGNGANESVDLKQMFAHLSANLTTKDHKSFSRFILNGTSITEIFNYTFSDILFKRIEIYNARSLRRIHPNAFQDYNIDSIQEFKQFGDSQLGSDEHAEDMFQALSTLINLREVVFEKTLLSRIESRAFAFRAGAQNELTSIDFGGKAFGDNQQNLHIESVGNYSFYYLAGLTSINLQSQQIQRIGIQAFDIWKPSPNVMRISLIKNRINDSSIEIGAFTNAKRQLFVELGHNNLTTLDERVFGNILRVNPRNLLYFDGNSFVCDCRMHWLRIEREYYIDQTKYIACVNYNNTDFWSLTEKIFSSCVD